MFSTSACKVPRRCRTTNFTSFIFYSWHNTETAKSLYWQKAINTFCWMQLEIHLVYRSLVYKGDLIGSICHTIYRVHTELKAEGSPFYQKVVCTELITPHSVLYTVTLVRNLEAVILSCTSIKPSSSNW